MCTLNTQHNKHKAHWLEQETLSTACNLNLLTHNASTVVPKVWVGASLVGRDKKQKYSLNSVWQIDQLCCCFKEMKQLDMA